MISLLLGLLVFLVPSNLFLKFAEETAYVRGLQIDYLIPRISIQMIVVAILIATLARRVGVEHIWYELSAAVSKHKFLCALLLALFVRQFFARHPIIAVETFAEWLFFGSLVWLSQLKKIKPQFQQFFASRHFLWSLLLTLTFQSCLAIYQFIAQKSFAGYWFLGEGNMQSFAGLAKIELFGQLWTAPMGTTAHPNVLGGVLALYMVLSLWVILRKEKKETLRMLKMGWLSAAIVSVTALFLTQSVSAWLSLTAGVLLIAAPLQNYRKQILVIAAIIFIASPFVIHRASQRWPYDESLVRRDYLNQASWNMWLAHPLLGVGMQNNTAYIEAYSEDREVVRFTQPAHHILLLLLTEQGVAGLILFGIGAKWVRPSKKGWLLAAVLAIASLDHYLMTVSSGRALCLFILLVLINRHRDGSIDMVQGQTKSMSVE